jgi:hypothetical protein
MNIRLHEHAVERLVERGATQEEVILTVLDGEPFPAKFERSGFRRNFGVNQIWRGKLYANKQVEAIAVREGDNWLVLTVITRYF